MSGPDIHYHHMVEIGAGDRYSSIGGAMLKNADKITLYEPNLLLCNDLKSVSANIDHVRVHQVAVGETTGTALLVHLGYASYILGSPSFLKLSIEQNGEEWFKPLAKEIKVVGMGEIDDGQIDYLVLTNNGYELPVLRAMKSRPSVIHTKHYIHNGFQHEELNRVCNFFRELGYGATILESNRYQTFFHLLWRKRVV